MTLNIEAESSLRNLSNENLILIPPSTLHVTKQKLSQNAGKEQPLNSNLMRTKSSSYSSLPHGSRSNRKSKKQSEGTVCRSIGSAERVVQVQAQLLTPKSASKIYGSNKSRPPVSFNRFSKNDPRPNLQTSVLDENILNSNYHDHTTSYSSADSTITDSVLDDSATIDTSSLFSETTSYCTEDGIERTLSFSLPEENETNTSASYVSQSFIPNVNHNAKYSLCYEDSNSAYNGGGDNTIHKNINISPTLSLPISTIQSKQNLAKFHRKSDYIYKNHLSESESFSDASLLSEDEKLSELPSFRSCSSLSLDQDGLMLNGYSSLNDIKSFENANGSKLGREVMELKQSLKLSEADTAILVSSKQQLQLNVHELKEKGKTLEAKLNMTQKKLNKSEVDALVAKRSLERLKENCKNEINSLDDEKLAIKNTLKETTDQLYSLKLENDQLKSSNSNIKLKLEAELLGKEMLKKELHEFTVKNSKLDLLLQESCNKNVDNKDYINIIRTGHTDQETKNYKKDQEILNQNLKLMQLQDMYTTLEKSNTKLNQTNRQLSDSVQLHKKQVESLKNEVSVKAKEKMKLDGAVTKLHGDLHLVGTAFNKIREDIKQKSSSADLALNMQSHLEKTILDLEKELSECKKELETRKQRISDKNNQIAQVVAQLKINTESKKKGDRKIEKMESVIKEYEQLKNTKPKISELEAELNRELKEKTTNIIKNENVIQSLQIQLDCEKNEKIQIQIKLQELMTNDELKQSLIEELEENMKKLNDKLKLQDINYKDQEKATENLRLAADNAKVLEIKLREKVDDLQKQIVENQSISTQESESKSLQHLDILPELQSSRRQLINEAEEIKSKNKDMSEEIEKLNGHLDYLTKENVKFIEQSKGQEIDIEKYRFEVSDYKSKYDESEKLVQLLKENSSILSQTISTLQDENSKWKNKIEVNSKEIEFCNKQKRTLNEELDTAKQQLNDFSLQLVEKTQTHETISAQLKQSYEYLSLERDKLKEAVGQQQRYIVSLQQHYQQWASNASTMIQQQAQHQQSNQHSERKDALKKEIGTQTSRDNFPIMTSQMPLQSRESSDIGIQTDHSEKPMTSRPYKSYDHICTQTDNVFIDIGIQKNQDLKSSFSQTENAFNATTVNTQTDHNLSNRLTQTVTTEYSSINTQTDILHKPIVKTENKLFDEVNTRTNAILHSEKNSANEFLVKSEMQPENLENFPDMAMVNDAKVYDISRNHAHGNGTEISDTQELRYIDNSTQTLHDESILPLPLGYSKNFEENCSNMEKFEIGTQTIVDFKLLQDSFQKKSKDCGIQTNHSKSHIMTSSYLLNSTLDDENAGKLFNDVGSQTLHDEIPIIPSQGKPIYVNLCHINTQTDHNQQPVTSLPTIEEQNKSSQTDIFLSKEFGIQTSFGEISSVDVKNSFTQTWDSSKEVEIQTHFNEISTFSQTASIKVGTVETQTENFCENSVCENCERRKPILLGDVGTQTPLKNDGKIPKNLQECSSQTDANSVDLPPLPNPLDVAKLLHDEDSVKLSAYKKTVKLLKSRLKTAENEYKKSTDLLREEIDSLKENLGSELGRGEKDKSASDLEEMDKENVALKNEMIKMKETQQKEIEKVRKRSGIHRIQAERRIRDATERIKALVDANERLRKMVEKLQVKLTYSNKQQEISRREKIRYQQRARKLQSDLRSLSWLSTSNNQAKDNQRNEDANSNGTDKLHEKLPTAVGEIDDILKTLRCEISALERQLSDHTSIVDQSNASWKKMNLQSEAKNRDTEITDGAYIV